jgi:hypothetical protein
MENEDLNNEYGPYSRSKMGWRNDFFLTELPQTERVIESFDILRDYSTVYNLYTANTPQPNPFSNKAMFIIDMLTKMGIKYTLDIFTYEGYSVQWGVTSNSHKLINIIAEPNPNATGPAVVFCAHHDVMNVHSQNCQDNGASVSNLLRLAAMINKAQKESKRTIILFSDSEESGARGAKRFASKSSKKRGSDIIEHNIYGQIDSVINLELTGNGTIVWSDCEARSSEIKLHESLENVLGQTIPKLKTPPSDAIPFRSYGFPVLCIGILPEHDFKEKQTWRLCHSVKDTLEGCDRNSMEDFTKFLFNLTKTNETINGINNRANQT